MANLEMFPACRSAALLLTLAVLAACGSGLGEDYPRPSEPAEVTLYDLATGPIDGPSCLDVVMGRGRGQPRPVRVDLTDEWDIAFALLEGDTVWLPRGFFESIEPSSGILALERTFEEVARVPENKDLYEVEDPVPISVGGVYAIRSRSDPSLALPCHIFAKVVVDAIEGDPVRVRIRSLWNPNCDDTNVTPEEGS